MAKALVVVESPAKAKTINKYLGRDYKVVASMGHIRDLPKSKLGVDVENDFAEEYESIASRKKVLKELKDACRRDRARTKVYSFTELGLVEMTRKRVRRSLSKSLAESCPTCNGRGFLVKWGGRTIQDSPADEAETQAEPAASGAQA